jgi:hypothetical protein
MECLSFWPTYIGEKGRTMCKTYGFKARCYWEQPGGTHWAHDGNLEGTYWEQRKNEKKSPLPPPTKLKRKKKSRHFKHMLSLPIGCMKFLLPKLFITILAWANNTPIINWGYLFYYIGC